MVNVTKHLLHYPTNQEPNLILPEEYGPYRYVLGKKGHNPLVVICMNPSAATEDYSDMTINRIIRTSIKLKRDGWIVFNLYPERATNKFELNSFDNKVSKDNLEIIKKILVQKKINEVWGAWGNSYNIETLILAKKELLDMLGKINVKIFYFGTLTKENNPPHPLQRIKKIIYDEQNKKYLRFS